MDFYIDQNMDIQIANGDFIISDNNVQDYHCLLKTAPGEWRFDNRLGVNIKQYLGSKRADIYIKSNIEEQRRLTGLPRFNITIDNLDDLNITIRLK
jgi:hypothetical protein